jgi:carbamoylphosphate synthase small subunit
MLRKILNEIKSLGMKSKKTNQLSKWLKKITITKIDTTKLDIKIQWKEMLKERIEQKINQENDWKQKK